MVFLTSRTSFNWYSSVTAAVKSAATVVAVLVALVAAWVPFQAQEQAEEFPVLQWHQQLVMLADAPVVWALV